MPGKDSDPGRINELVAELIAKIGRKRARQLLSLRDIGRPLGSGAIDDAAALRHMADLVRRGERSERRAATDSAHLTHGNSLPAIRDRLRRKFRRDREALLRKAAQKRAPSAADSAVSRQLAAVSRQLAQQMEDLEQMFAIAAEFTEAATPLTGQETFEQVERELRQQLGQLPDD